jgi:hypothetical protein
MNIEREIRSLIKYLDEECDQPYEEIFDQIVRLVNERVGELLQEIDRLKKQDIDVIISYAVERQKLIEVLRFYGDEETYEGDVEWDDAGNIIHAKWAPINLDNGQRARDILAKYAIDGGTRP